MDDLTHYILFWLTTSWTEAMGAPLGPVAAIFVATICGAIIGTEREKREKPAGLRTLMLVCLGSAGFTLVSFAFTTSTGDSGRVAAQIVTGIGFLGAGVILHPRGTISGATTAASIWVTAAIGMMAGAGYAGAAIGMAILVRLVLGGIAIYENHLFGSRTPITVSLDIDPVQGCTRVHIERILVDYPRSAATAEWGDIHDGLQRVTLRLRLPRHHLRELLDDLVNITEVKRVADESAAPVGSV